ncbi:phosphatase [Pollutimonas nitritireducens]|uniref:Phosphatase n=1 Tax=Pollutimonas nitritireducens TaxID=2045209 RepID=A0A2N4UEN8_9BURK|nr:3',5'-nucleoside bisphosphate phosphatase [Pollutimonas nitritireducens]PLC53484.1 phosphatase [Pollutimonas nitritireducens]
MLPSEFFRIARVNIKVDLHSHSVVSDGVLAPSELAARAHANGVQLWALTDHDELSGIAEARQSATSLGMSYVSGVEVSVTWGRQTIHVLGLNVDETNAGLNAGLAEIRAGRSVRAREMADRLTSMGVPDSYAGAMKFAGNPSLISRTHFARFLVEQGYCKNMQMVFDKYLGENKPANVQVHWSTLAQAVSWIVAAGGRAAIAHPGRYDYSPMQFDALFDEFKELGGTAIEVITGSHTSAQYVQYAGVARRYGFLASCGSDFHSPTEARLDLGELPSLPSDLTPVWHDWV